MSGINTGNKMASYKITGPTKITGNVKIGGAKNAALKLMAASLLSDDDFIIENIPSIEDVSTMCAVLRTLGKNVDFTGANTLSITAKSASKYEAPYDLVSKMRASIIVLGPLLAKLGRAKVAMPGGCNIGSRKIDLHIQGLEKLGARITIDKGYIEARARKLEGTEIILDFPSVGATENILMAAVLADGKTIIENVAREPEITDLAYFLKKMGAKISGIGSPRLEIQGVKELKGCKYKVLPDRIEAGTFMIAASITGGELSIKNVVPEHLELVINKLKAMNIHIEDIPNGLKISSQGHLQAVDVVTLPYPGFPTDIQAQILSLLSLAKGTSILTENVFENRFLAVDELNRMGADIRTEGHHAVIRGVKRLQGVPVTARDLRGGAALVLAGLAAEGVTEIFDVGHIDRGYEDIERKLNSLGAKIERFESTT